MKGLYEDKIGYSLNGVKFSVTRGALPSMAELEQADLGQTDRHLCRQLRIYLGEAVVAKSSLW